MMFSLASRRAVPRLLQQRSFVAATKPLFAGDLPYHIVVGMPALSPTMESGNLAEWYVNEGDSFAAGDAIAKIETDKASIDFEAQDDAFVAKIIAKAGDGADIAVGTPIMITVEEEGDIAAFKDYKVEAAPEKKAPEPPKEEPKKAELPKEEPKKVEAPPKQAEAPPKQVEAPPKQAEAPPKQAQAPPAAPTPPVSPSSTSVSPAVAWGKAASKNSPLKATLSKQQLAYIETYGTTGQVPM